MALGDNPYDVTSQVTQAINDNKVSVTLKPSQADENVQRDKFGKPINDLPTTTIDIVVTKADQTIKPTLSGAQPVEQLEFYSEPNSVNENDEVTWNGYVFRVSGVWPLQLGGITAVFLCHAEREIDV